jgi:UDP-N-acetylmuramoyl-L-alanyl-D-glutamate--2,6-diaminopimelate ligase
MTRKNTAPRRSIALGRLAAAVSGAQLRGAAGTPISGITYDSRTAGPGVLFAALVGSDFDGHDYVDRAVASGAAAVLVERPMAVDIPQVVVPGSSRAALAPVSRAFYGDPSRELTVIGITGTDGKTTTAAMLEGILAGTGRQVGGIGTVGIRIGDGTTHDLGHQTTPESVNVQRYLREMVDAGTEYAVLEATSHGLATHRLDGVSFVAGGVTNITHEHLEFHKTIENYRRAKATLLERVAESLGVVVINNDDEGARAILPFAGDATVLTYSLLGEGAHLVAREIRSVRSGQAFNVVARHTARQSVVSLPMPGRFNVANALCAIGLAMGVGVPLEDAARALSGAKPVSGRMQQIEAGQPFQVIVDYAHTPESIRTILSLLRGQYPDGRLIVVTGSAGERDVTKRSLQGAACAEVADITVVTSEDPRHEDPEAINDQIVAGAVAAGAVRGESVLAITDRREAIRRALELAGPGDCVLLAGKGHETSIIWGFEHVPWNEAAVAEELLREMFGDASST